MQVYQEYEGSHEGSVRHAPTVVGWPKEGDGLYYRTAVLVVTRNMKGRVVGMRYQKYEGSRCGYVRHPNTIGFVEPTDN
jgi:hypothetical protein